MATCSRVQDDMGDGESGGEGGGGEKNQIIEAI